MLIRMGMGGQFSGSMGAVTASHNRYGQYMRNRSVPVNPNTNRQQQARAAFASATLAWKTLTGAQRAGWTAYAEETPILNKFGESVIPTGQTMYVRTNTFLVNLGQAAINDAPPTPGLSTLGTGLVLAAVEVAPAVSLTAVGGTALGPAIIQMGPALSAGRTFFRGPYTLVADATLVATGGGAVPVAGRYGLPLVGQRRPMRIRGSDADGRLSNAFEQIVVVT